MFNLIPINTVYFEIHPRNSTICTQTMNSWNVAVTVIIWPPFFFLFLFRLLETFEQFKYLRHCSVLWFYIEYVFVSFYSENREKFGHFWPAECLLVAQTLSKKSWLDLRSLDFVRVFKKAKQFNSISFCNNLICVCYALGRLHTIIFSIQHSI